MKKNVNKEDILYLDFLIRQKFNLRPIKKLDENGKQIKLISINFPDESKYCGCYISVDNRRVYNSPNPKQQFTTIMKNSSWKVWKYEYDPRKGKKEQKAQLVATLTGAEVVQEFDMWRNTD